MVIRKLKFRGYDKNGKQMYFGSPVYLYSGTKDGELDYLCEYITGSHLSKESLDQKGGYDFEIMQFTGLLDKHGKEIYEGDIFYETFPTGESYTIIKFGIYNNGAGTPDNISGNGWYKEAHRTILKEQEVYITSFDEAEYDEIIGNIYENPELLGGGDINV